MRAFFAATTGFPILLFTAALLVVLGFWLLVAFRAAGADSFDADVDLDAWGLDGVPVALAFSVLTVFAWLLGLGAVILLDVLGSTGMVTVLVKLAVPVVALLLAWRLTRLFVRPLHRLFPDDPAVSRPARTLADGVAAPPTDTEGSARS